MKYKIIYHFPKLDRLIWSSEAENKRQASVCRLLTLHTLWRISSLRRMEEMHSENVDWNRIQNTLSENSGICESWNRNLHTYTHTKKTNTSVLNKAGKIYMKPLIGRDTQRVIGRQSGTDRRQTGRVRNREKALRKRLWPIDTRERERDCDGCMNRNRKERLWQTHGQTWERERLWQPYRQGGGTEMSRGSQFVLFRFVQRFGPLLLLGWFDVFFNLLHLVCLCPLKDT